MMNQYVAKAIELGAIQVYANTLQSGQWRDESGNGHHANLHNGADLVTSGGPAPNLSHFLDLDGTNDFARVPHDSQIDFSSTQSGSHVVWVYIPSNWGNTDEWGAIFSKGSGGYELRRQQLSSSGMRADPRAGNGSIYSPVPQGQWVCFVVTVNPTSATSSTKRLYRRTTNESSFSLVLDDLFTDGRSNYQSTSHPFHFGSRAHISTPERFFNGRIAGYIAFKNKVLSTSEMDELFDAAFAAQKTLSGSVTGHQSLSVNLDIDKLFAGMVTAEQTLATYLNIEKPLSGSLFGTTDITLGLQVHKQLEAQLDYGVGFLSGLLVSKGVAGEIVGVAEIFSAVHLSINLSSNLSLTSTNQSNIFINKEMWGSVLGETTLFGTLLTQITSLGIITDPQVRQITTQSATPRLTDTVQTYRLTTKRLSQTVSTRARVKEL